MSIGVGFFLMCLRSNFGVPYRHFPLILTACSTQMQAVYQDSHHRATPQVGSAKAWLFECLIYLWCALPVAVHLHSATLAVNLHALAKLSND